MLAALGLVPDLVVSRTLLQRKREREVCIIAGGLAIVGALATIAVTFLAVVSEPTSSFSMQPRALHRLGLLAACLALAASLIIAGVFALQRSSLRRAE